MDRRREKLLVCLMLLVLAAAGFHSLPQCDFINLDDSNYVQNNSVMGHGLSLHSIHWAFTTWHAGYWIPLTWLSLLLDSHLYGMNAGGYHLTNLLFHMANGFLLFLLLNRATKRLWLSAMAAALFIIHPIQVESVAWITERKDVLSVFFWMLTLHAYLSYVKMPGKRALLAALALFTLGLMAKPMIVTLPCVMLLFDFWPLGRMEGDTARDRVRRLGELLWEKAPFFLLAAFFSVLTVVTQRSGHALVGLDTVPFQDRLTAIGPAYAAYLKNIFWPSRLAVFYPPEVAGFWAVLLSWLGLGAISAFATAMWKRGYVFVGWFFFLGVLFPVSGVMQSGLQGMADRFAYIPVIGVFILAVWGVGDLVQRFPRARVPAVCVGAAVLVVFSMLTHRQASYWRDSATLLERTVSVTTDNWFAEQLLGSALFSEKRYDEALVHLERSLRINPTFAPSYNDMGMIMDARGEYAKAVEYYLRAIGDGALEYHYYNNLGLTYCKMGEERKALEAFMEALKRESGSHALHFNIGMVLQQIGNFELAKRHYERALELSPNFDMAANNLGIIAVKQGAYDQAIRYFRQTIMAQPKYAPAYFNLGKLLNDLGQPDKALPFLETAVKESPEDWSARNLLGKTLASQGRVQEAKIQYEAILKGDPKNADAAQGLASLSQPEKETRAGNP